MSSSGSDTEATSEFQSLNGDDPDTELNENMKGRDAAVDEVFETSGCSPEVNEHDGEMSASTAQSSLCSSKEDPEAAWVNAKLPSGSKEICNQAAGVLYIERYESFIRNNWPYDVKRGNLCHPRALALAGLQFNSLEPSPSAKCVVCLSVLEELQANSNPWMLHAEMSPDCYIITLGQRDEVDDYTMDQVMEMIFRKICNEAEKNVKESEKVLKQQLFQLREHEKTLEAAELKNGNY